MNIYIYSARSQDNVQSYTRAIIYTNFFWHSGSRFLIFLCRVATLQLHANVKLVTGRKKRSDHVKSRVNSQMHE